MEKVREISIRKILLTEIPNAFLPFPSISAIILYTILSFFTDNQQLILTISIFIALIGGIYNLTQNKYISFEETGIMVKKLFKIKMIHWEDIKSMAIVDYAEVINNYEILSNQGRVSIPNRSIIKKDNIKIITREDFEALVEKKAHLEVFNEVHKEVVDFLFIGPINLKRWKRNN